MSKTSTIPRIGFLLFLATFASSAAAQFYLGAAVGNTNYKDAEYFDFAEESTPFELNAGLHIQEGFAVEVSYLNLGDVRDYYLGADINVSGTTLSGKAILPLTPQLDLYGKMGIFFSEMNEIYRNRTYYLDEGEHLIYGGGLTFHLNHQLGLNVEYRVVSLEYGAVDLYDMETSLTTVGLTFAF